MRLVALSDLQATEVSKAGEDAMRKRRQLIDVKLAVRV